MNDLYARQEELGLDVPDRVAVVGCGGVGSWAAMFLAMTGVEELALIDPDVVEAHNLNRMPFRPSDVGKPKVRALREAIARVRPHTEVHPYPRAVDEELLSALIGRGFLVLDCTDRISVQRLTAEVAPQRARAGYDGGTSVTVTDGPPPAWGNQEDEPYRVVPSWVCGAALAGLLAVAKLCKWKSARLSLDLGDLMEGDA